MTTTVPARNLEIILRVIPQLTDVQLECLAASRSRIDDTAFELALERVCGADPEACDALEELTEPLWCASVGRYQQWAEDQLDLQDASDSVLESVLVAALLLGTPAAAVLAVQGLVSPFAPLVVLVVSVLAIFVRATAAATRRARTIRARGRRLDLAWEAIEGVAHASGASHTLGVNGGPTRADFDLLSGPWSAQILRVDV